ncbi:metallophosphoesterase family protein [candidate division KSB1 bacterium]|nr:metallophosphoesterase family protein [candidate division KSB1 bacterium]RQW08964.1 MAG: metallophosphoesterase [candidate division KSB1 bacterium]
MTSRLRKQIKILSEHIKVPGRLVRLSLKLVGLYERGLQNAHDLQIRRYTLEFSGVAPAFDGYTMLLMSDLHIDSELRMVPRIEKILIDTPADILLFAGDYRYRLTAAPDLAIKRMRKIIEAARVHDGIYAVRGNHDSRKMMATLSQLGVHILDNDSVQITRDDSSIYLLGVDEPHYDKEDDLPAAMQTVPANAFKILVAHTAEIYEQAEDLGIDFYLCGHTHGGQICLKRIGPIITNVSAPRRFARGFWQFKRMRGYTTTGVGVSAAPIRFHCPPEIVLFTLRSARAD